MNKQIVVGIADMKITRAPGTLITYALGSCVGICIYDPVIKLAGMIHVMLPDNPDQLRGNIYKYADTGIPQTIKKMEIFGGVRRRMVSKIAGGAKMFDIPGNGSLGNIGLRNIENVKKVLRKEGIPILKEDVGANYARTLSFDAETGEGRIRTYGKGEFIF